MGLPSGLAYAIAVLMLGISVSCACRIALARRLGRRSHHDVDLAHLLMGLAMAGTFVPGWRIAPTGTWEVVFAAVGTYFLFLSARCVARGNVTGDDHGRHVSHSAIHLVLAGTMSYMFWLTTSMGLSASMTMSVSGSPRGVRDPTFTLALVVVLVGALIWQLDARGRFALQRQRILVSGVAEGAVDRVDVAPGSSLPWLAPRLEIATDVAMCLAMGYMLVLMM